MTYPILPDKSYKLLVYLGVALIFYAWISRYNQFEKYEQKRIEYEVEIRRLKNQSKYLDEELVLINTKAEELAKSLDKDNPLTISDSGYTFTKTLKGDRISMTLSDSITSLLKTYTSKNNQIAKKNDELSIKEYELDSVYDTFNEIDNFALGLSVVGVLLTFIGLGIWSDSETLQERILTRKNLHLPTFSENCQSCGLEFNSLIKYSKEDSSGKRNYHFCSRCYDDGEFLDKELTLEKLKESRKELLIKKSMSEKKINKHLNRLGKLDRWK